MLRDCPAVLRRCSLILGIVLIVLIALDGRALAASVLVPPSDPYEPNNDFRTATAVSLTRTLTPSCSLLRPLVATKARGWAFVPEEGRLGRQPIAEASPLSS